MYLTGNRLQPKEREREDEAIRIHPKGFRSGAGGIENVLLFRVEPSGSPWEKQAGLHWSRTKEKEIP